MSDHFVLSGTDFESERAAVVRSLHGDVASFLLASVAVIISICLTAIHHGSYWLWLVAGANTAIPLVRIAAMLQVARISHRPNFNAKFWEHLYNILGSLHVFAVGFWTVVVVRLGGDAFCQVVSFTTAIGYLVGIQARNFASRRTARMQIVAAGIPLISALLIKGDLWYFLYAFILLSFFMGLLRTNRRMCDTFLTAVRTAQTNEKLAYFDSLTQLPNRVSLTARLEDATRDPTKPFALHFLDLDRFKRINDTLGHGAGDKILIETARRFHESFSDTAFVARFAGDEFVILQPGVEHEGTACAFGARISEIVSAPYDVYGMPLNMTCSIGTTLYPRDGMDAETLMRRSDAAMYEVKEKGRGGLRLFSSDLIEKEEQRLSVETGLREALDAKRLQLYFQPIIAPGSCRATTCEALIRWIEPDGHSVPPGTFIPIAEECGLINRITDWTLNEACRVARGWPAEVRVAVNLSPNQFLRGDLIDIVSAALQNAGLPASRLELEITENVFVSDFSTVVQTLEILRSKGITIALDDFGTGYSNFSHIAQLPVDKVKIDRSFVTDLPADPSRQALFVGLVRFVSSLGLEIVCEGVETLEEYEFVVSTGAVSQVQGYIFGRPLPHGAIGALLGSTFATVQPKALAASSARA